MIAKIARIPWRCHADDNSAGFRMLSRRLLARIGNGCRPLTLGRSLRTRDDSELLDFPSDLLSKAQHAQRDQTKNSFRPKVDPSTTTLLLFPGQGSQFVGMGREVIQYEEAKELYSIASAIIGYDLLKVCLEGPVEALNRTEVCQMAVFVTSVAALMKLREERPVALENCVGTAGFSVGEYAALVFAGCLSFEDAVHVVQARALAMQAASDSVSSGLVSVFLSHKSKLNYALLCARKACSHVDRPVCSVANYLFPDVKVIGGHREALDFLKENAEDFYLRRLKELPVSGAFHTDLMRPALPKFKEALDNVTFAKPIVPVHSNVNCQSYGRNLGTIKKLLCEQIWKPVRWEQTMHLLYQREQGVAFPTTYEVGPGNQLGTILRMVNRKAHHKYHQVTV